MGSVVITGSNSVAITDHGIQVGLPDTDVVFKYDTATHTITLEGAEFAMFGDELGKAQLRFSQGKGRQQEIVLLHPDWPGLHVQA